MLKAKILLIGPCKSGKSVIANFLAEATENSGGEYHPTKGVRILEFETSGSWSGNRTSTAEIELWDCSGDAKYDECWPAMVKDANGVAIVYSPDQTAHEKELETWYQHFVTNQGMKDTHCALIANHKPSTGETTVRISKALSKLPLISCNLETDPDGFRREFKTVLLRTLGTLSQRQDQEELSIIQ